MEYDSKSIEDMKWFAGIIELLGDREGAAQYRAKAKEAQEVHNALCHMGEPCYEGRNCTAHADESLRLVYESFTDPVESLVAIKVVTKLFQQE